MELRDRPKPRAPIQFDFQYELRPDEPVRVLDVMYDLQRTCVFREWNVHETRLHDGSIEYPAMEVDGLYTCLPVQRVLQHSTVLKLRLVQQDPEDACGDDFLPREQVLRNLIVFWAGLNENGEHTDHIEDLVGKLNQITGSSSASGTLEPPPYPVVVPLGNTGKGRGKGGRPRARAGCCAAWKHR